ncbi:MAG: hypothetical protein HN704_13045 [Bacteroidetes bacterium]|jgi:hypothetical protein|nr:hypothetical protein [Bacteroidota bacterium]MBT7492522.1 hypothetical protein [Bacteroidota bacterium]
MKKIIYLISIFISISIICKSQVICDDTNCIAIGLTDDLIKEPDKIIRKSKHKFDELKKYNKKFEVDCEWPTFYIFNKHGEKYLSHAEAVGTAVEIKNHSNTIQAKFIPITWRGEEQLVVNDFNGDAIFMDMDFKHYIIKKQFWCKGLPFEPTRYHKCKYCDETYKTQKFKNEFDEKNSIENFVINGRNCQSSKNDNHNDMKLYNVEDCDCIDGIFVEDNSK